MHVVIVGNGPAGMEAALGLRAREPGARITLVSAEHDHHFSRTALMYVLCGQLSLRDTEPYDRGLYERLRFERVRGRVTRLDPVARRLHLEDGRTLEGDAVLLAVGSRARPGPWPGAEGPGVHRFVTLDDLAALDAEARPGRRAVVIGGGLIGVEVAEVLQLRGLPVTFLVREPWYFPLALDAREAAVVTDHVRAHGVDVRLGFDVQRVDRADGRVTGVTGTGGTVPADLVVTAIGVVPATGFLRDSGLALAADGAVEVDAGLRSVSHLGVWAAGDCANVDWIDGTRRPEPLWYTARDQGRVAARSILGDPVTYRRTSWYNAAKFFDIEYTTAGWVPVAARPDAPALPAGYRDWYQQVPGRPVTQRIVLRGDRVVGFNCLGSRWDTTVFLRWIEERRGLDWVLAHMERARFDEEGMPPFRVLPGATLTEGA